MWTRVMPKVVMHSNYRMERRVKKKVPSSTVSARGADAEP